MQRWQLEPVLFTCVFHAGQGRDFGKKPHRSAPTKNAGPLHYPFNINAERLQLEGHTGDRFTVVNGYDEACQLVGLVRTLCCRVIHGSKCNASRCLNQALTDIHRALACERFGDRDQLIPEALSSQRWIGLGPQCRNPRDMRTGHARPAEVPVELRTRY
jgi:hypothetical protein